MSPKRQKRLVVHMIGNAHIDPVWLWPWQAGVDEALASFRSAADRCDEYPEFIYTRGEAWLYEQVEKIDPDLFARVKKLVKKGQWHITGGQYVQPDANLPSVLGWSKQLLRGSTYFKERFGVSSHVGYNVDTFGHPATLPDLLAAHGFDSYVFHRPTTKQMALPSQTFRWRGRGGSEVLAFRIAPAYTSRTDNLYGQIMLSAEASNHDIGHTMCFYGVGNHGGGPTKGNIEYILNNQLTFPGIELRFSTPEIFFDEVRKKNVRLPVVEAELQHTQPGCYSVMHDIKQAQRHSEHLLGQCERAVELWSLDKTEQKRHLQRIGQAWDDLLFTQFHDILAGTSFPSAWKGVRDMQGRARLVADEILVEITRRWARKKLPKINHQQIAFFNPSADEWDDVVECEPFLDFQRWGNRWLSDLDGNPIDFQMIQPEAAVPFSLRMAFRVKIPARSAKILLVRDDPRPPAPASPKKNDLLVSPARIKNGHLEVGLGPKGISSIKYAGQPLLGAKGLSLLLRNDSTDTWTLHTDKFTEKITETLTDAVWQIEEDGPVRARVHTTCRLGDSSIRWTLGLGNNDPRLVMDLEIDFREGYRLLQMPVHLRKSPSKWTAGLVGGSIDRASGLTEWPVVGWSKVRSADLDVGLVTQDAYSLRLDGNTWQWTLLRSPRMAWGGSDPSVFSGRVHHTDQGTHHFRFVLHVGRHLSVAALETAARRAADVPIIFDRYEGMNRPAWGENPPRYLWTGAEQRAQNDGQLTALVPTDVKGIEE